MNSTALKIDDLTNDKQSFDHQCDFVAGCMPWAVDSLRKNTSNKSVKFKNPHNALIHDPIITTPKTEVL